MCACFGPVLMSAQIESLLRYISDLVEVNFVHYLLRLAKSAERRRTSKRCKRSFLLARHAVGDVWLPAPGARKSWHAPAGTRRRAARGGAGARWAARRASTIHCAATHTQRVAVDHVDLLAGIDEDRGDLARAVRSGQVEARPQRRVPAPPLTPAPAASRRCTSGRSRERRAQRLRQRRARARLHHDLEARRSRPAGARRSSGG